jgi:hypothetical protein
LRFQARACERVGSPLYADLFDRAAVDVEAHGPVWEVLRGHEGDPAPSALALRLMGAVNRLVVQGDEPALAAAYRDDRDREATWQTLVAVLEGNVERLRQLVELPVQTNEVGRSAALLPGFLTFAAQSGLPLRLLEVGASAGLNLRWDRYRYCADSFSWGPADSPLTIEFELHGTVLFPTPAEAEIAERRGCDASPIDPATPEGRLSLLSFVWPDQPARATRLRAALDLAAELPVPIDREAATAWTAKRLGKQHPGKATLLYHSIVAQYMSEEERTAFHRQVEEAGARASDDAPLAWLRMEPAGERAEVWLSTWPDGVERCLARVGYHGSPVELSPA